ncbi:MAG: HEPN domain-containing protein [Thermodesulfovibrionales bacterium]
MSDIHVIKIMDYFGKFSDIDVFLDYTLGSMGNQQAIKKTLRKWTNGIPELLLGLHIENTSLSPEQMADVVINGTAKIKQNFLSKFHDSKKTVLNMSLVMSCTILEMFFEHVFLTVMAAKPETMLRLSKDKNITLDKLLKFKTLDDALNEFREKYINHIMRQGTREILQAFDSIGISIEKVFSWENFTDEAQKELQGWDADKLVSIFEERHSIVHDNALPISTIDEFNVRKEFFTKLAWNLSIQTAQKFGKHGVVLDLLQMVTQPAVNPADTTSPTG